MFFFFVLLIYEFWTQYSAKIFLQQQQNDDSTIDKNEDFS